MKTGMVDLQLEASRVLARLQPALEADLAVSIRKDPRGWQLFTKRLETHFPQLFELYHHLYGQQYDMVAVNQYIFSGCLCACTS